MGSFNIDCFVSHQVIAPHQKVWVMPVSQQTSYNEIDLLVPSRTGKKMMSKMGYMHSTCYPTAYWDYEGPILKGEYDDYGRISWENSPSNEKQIKSFLNHLSSSVCDVMAGKNECHEKAFQLANIYNSEKTYTFENLVEILDEVWECAQEGRLFVKNSQGNVVSTAFSVMHGLAGNYLLETISNSESWDGTKREFKEFFNRYVNSRMEQAYNFMEKRKKDTGKEDPSLISNFGVSKILNLESFNIGSESGSNIDLNYDWCEEDFEKMEAYFKGKKVFEKIPKEITDDWFEFVRPKVEHRYVSAGLESLNIKLSPMVTASQDYENEMGKGFLAMVKEVNKRVKNDLMEKNGEVSTPRRRKMK